jgi:hypothetical protein
MAHVCFPKLTQGSVLSLEGAPQIVRIGIGKEPATFQGVMYQEAAGGYSMLLRRGPAVGYRELPQGS